jgi:hypothetical protein
MRRRFLVLLTAALLTLAGDKTPPERPKPFRKAEREEVVLIREGETVLLFRKDDHVIHKITHVSGETILSTVTLLHNAGRSFTVTGVKPGVARLSLGDPDGNEEKVIVAVEQKEK